MPDGNVVFEIVGDNKPVKAALDDTTRAIEKAGKQWDKSASGSMGDAFQSISGTINKIKQVALGSAVGKFLLDFGSAAVSAASDLKEVQNVVDVTFGEGAEQIESWAKTAQSQFGLTETQAKRFTSTMGAMMKSAGLTGPEIVGMSEDLAGLAADMASFYNMDFETAFQKIRSGISGETEPLKQLGINMSVANLEAFAMTQGITKAFDKMSQGEQTMLRYQYLMQATADAQGDFARTSDGYANAHRRVQTAMESIKTSLGEVVLPVVESITVGLAGLLEKLTAQPETTVLDTFNEIDINTENKLAEIQKTADQANALLGVLRELGGTSAGDAMEALANGANVLKADSPGTWSSLLDALKSVDGLENIFSNTSAGHNVEELATALSGASPDTDKAAAWNEFLSALNGNVGALTALTGTSADETSEWLSKIAAAANEIEPTDAEAWNKLLANFVSGLPGLKDTEGGKQFFDAMVANFLAMGIESEEAKNGLLALGFGTDEITDKQRLWLETCKRLVQTIPGLSSIINTQTGEVEGGTEAIADYVKEWKIAQENIAMIQALSEKKSALEKSLDTTSLKADVLAAREYAKLAREQYEQLMDARLAAAKTPVDRGEYEERLRRSASRGLSPAEKELKAALEAAEAADKAVETAEQRLKTVEEANKEAALQVQALENAMEGLTDSTYEAAAAQEAYTVSVEEIKPALETALDAFKALSEYQQKIRDETSQTIRQTVNGFENVQTPAMQTRAKMADLTSQIKAMNDEAKRGELEKTFASTKASLPSVQNMAQALREQLAYMKDYQKELALAREKGVSEDILAMLSDGSQESFDYLYALNHTGGNITGEGGLNDLYRQVQEEREKFTDTLTDEQLKADDAYDGLVAKAKEAAAGLNVSGDAYQSVAETVQAIVSALGDKKADVATQVDGILAEIARLANANFGVATLSPDFIGPLLPDGSHAMGLDYVPFNGYLAQLHEGEGILTAEENRVWRSFKAGQQTNRNSIDYGMLGTAMWENAPNLGGGNVYLDGQTVGRVISARQADSYRALERSGWQQ